MITNALINTDPLYRGRYLTNSFFKLKFVFDLPVVARQLPWREWGGAGRGGERLGMNVAKALRNCMSLATDKDYLEKRALLS